MKIRGHGSAVAVVLSVLAVVVAGGGTAVAVSSAVNIADPANPNRIAKVDQFGRLSVGGAVSTIDSAGYLYGYQDNGVNQLTSATTATLAISRLHVSNPSANSASPEQQFTVSKFPVSGTGACTATTAPVVLARYNVAPGDDVTDALPAPLIVKPTGNVAYCLYLTVLYLGDSTATPAYYSVYGLTAYVVQGSYTGIGLGTATAKQGSAAIPR